MELTHKEKEILEINSHISNEEVEQDIRDTQNEINIIRREIELAGVGINKRLAFNKKLTRLLELRSAQT